MPLWNKQDIADIFDASMEDENPLKQFSLEVGAKFVAGGFWAAGDKAIARVRDWDIVFHRFTDGRPRTVPFQYVRIITRYKKNDGFRLRLFHNSLINKIGKKFFSLQDIEIGHLPFDNEFIIKGNDSAKTCVLLANQKIREWIEAEPSIFLQVRDSRSWLGNRHPRGIGELCLQVQIPPLLHDDKTLRFRINQLKSLYELVVALLNQLCPMESAMESANEVATTIEKEHTFTHCAVQLSPFSLMTLTALSAFCGGLAWALFLSIGKQIGLIHMEYSYFHLVNFILYPFGAAFFAGLFSLIGYPIYTWICKNICGQKLQGIFHNPTDIPSL